MIPQIIISYITKNIIQRPLIKGIEIGTEKYEIGIKFGNIMTVLGDVIYNF